MKKGYNIIETIRLFVMKAQTNKAIDELYQFCNQHNIEEFRDQLVLLSSSLNEVKNSELMGLGKYVEEKNRINMALLRIIQKLDDQISSQKELITTATNQNEQIHLIESKLDFLLNHLERNDDITFYSFHNSSLWNFLEPTSQENLMTASIIEKEGEQDQYAEAILLYLSSVSLELDVKFLSKFKKSIQGRSLERSTIMDDFKGMNKGVFYEYLAKDTPLTLNQLAEILLANILEVDKTQLKGVGLDFYRCFYDTYKVKFDRKVIEFMTRYTQIKTKTVNQFTQTLIDVLNTKEFVISLFLNLQPKRIKKK